MLQVERTNTNEAETRGVVLVSYIAIKPLYISSPSLNDSAKRSPEASQAILSMPLRRSVSRALTDDRSFTANDDTILYLNTKEKNLRRRGRSMKYLENCKFHQDCIMDRRLPVIGRY